MSYEFDATFLTLLKDTHSQQPGEPSTSVRNLASRTSGSDEILTITLQPDAHTPSQRSRLSPNSDGSSYTPSPSSRSPNNPSPGHGSPGTANPNSSFSLAAETKMTFDLMVETGSGQKSDHNTRTKRRQAWHKKLNSGSGPAQTEAQNASNGFVPREPQMDELEKLIGKVQINIQSPTPALSPQRNAAVAREVREGDAKLAQDVLPSPTQNNPSASSMARPIFATLDRTSRRKPNQFALNPTPALATLAPPKQMDSLDLESEARPSPNAGQRAVVHPMSRRSTGKA